MKKKTKKLKNKIKIIYLFNYFFKNEIILNLFNFI